MLYRLFVNGVESWNYTLASPPAVVEEKTSSFWDKLRFG